MEIMIVVSIIALLAMIAVPSFMRAREHAQNAKFINNLRIATDAFQLYAIEHSAYPADVNRAIVPSGMAPYFGSKMGWTSTTPVGGNWDWDYNQFGFVAGVSVIGSSSSTQRFTEIDATLDDGDLSTGGFQTTASGRYTSIIE